MKADYLHNAYARYGRIVHQLTLSEAPRSFEALRQLLGDIAQPGLCCPQNDQLATTYSTIMDPTRRTMHLAAGNPNDTPFETIAL